MVDQGKDTTEYQVASSTAFCGVVATILGLIITAGSSMLEQVGQNTPAGIVVGGIVTVAGLVTKLLVARGYIHSRTEVKKTNEGKK